MPSITESPEQRNSIRRAADLLMRHRRCDSVDFTCYEAFLSQLHAQKQQPSSPSGKGLLKLSTPKKALDSLKTSLRSTITLSKRPSPDDSDNITCVCCRDDFAKGDKRLHTLTCGHTYCSDCIQTMAKRAIADRSSMPPHCCAQPFLAKTIKSTLSPEEQATFVRAVPTITPVEEDAMVCPNPVCVGFLAVQDKTSRPNPSVATCGRCSTRICVFCRRTAHSTGEDCPSDRGLGTVIKLASKTGWRRCYRCKTMVELTEGCFHMTCVCKAQFCYVCGASWDSDIGCPNFCTMGIEEVVARNAHDPSEGSRPAGGYGAAQLIEDTDADEDELRGVDSIGYAIYRPVASDGVYSLNNALTSLSAYTMTPAIFSSLRDGFDEDRRRHSYGEEAPSGAAPSLDLDSRLHAHPPTPDALDSEAA